MLTKVGLHFHLKAGPDEVVMYDTMLLAGPYYDVIYDDLTEAHDFFVDIVNEHLPGQLDDEDRESSYEYLTDIAEYFDEYDIEGIEVSKDGLYFGLSVCNQCVPKGMN
jgi:hypothetical protein